MNFEDIPDVTDDKKNSVETTKSNETPGPEEEDEICHPYRFI